MHLFFPARLFGSNSAIIPSSSWLLPFMRCCHARRALPCSARTWPERHAETADPLSACRPCCKSPRPYSLQYPVAPATHGHGQVAFLRIPIQQGCLAMFIGLRFVIFRWQGPRLPASFCASSNVRLGMNHAMGDVADAAPIILTDFSSQGRAIVRQ
jgi:hypothetical protein